MNKRTFAKTKNSDSATFSPMVDKKMYGQTFATESSDRTQDTTNRDFGHNFGNIRVHRDNQSRKESCPLSLPSPSRCPYGGACHTCPPRIQTKLAIGRSGDRFEHEADRVASQITRIPQAPVSDSGMEVRSDVSGRSDSSIRSLYGNGRPLSPGQRSFMEQRFMNDFSGVRVHTDAKAVQSARTVNALAYTVGQDIVFGKGQYTPETAQGRELLAHELTHVVQQTQGRTGSVSIIQREVATGPTPPADGGLSQEMLRQIARRLRNAMAGWGTDEDAIYAAMAGRTQAQVNAIARTYQEMYSRSLIADFRDELTSSEMAHLAIFSPTAAPGSDGTPAEQAAGLADVAASQLDRAMRGPGTDEDAIFAVLTGRTVAERQAIKDAYRRRTDRGLEADLRDDLSGSDLIRALRMLNQGLLQPEDELYLAMARWGTDEDTIFRVLDGLAGDNSAITSMEASYRSKYGDLIADLRSDLSSGEYERALRVLGHVIQDVAFEDCGTTIIPQVRALIPVGIQKVERAISVLSGGWASMTPAQQAEFTRFFDPSNSGYDSNFIGDVLGNFRSIRSEFDNDFVVECETSAGLCTGHRLYYTYWSNIHVCPYFTTETDNTRKARDLVHELAHNAMTALDRPYYSRRGSADYAALTPRGPWTNQIPVIGALARVISRSDTLYHPDAYSWFAFEVP